MGETVTLKHKRGGKRVAPSSTVKIPDDIAIDADTTAATLVATLRDCDGDIELFCKQFTTRSHTAIRSVLVKAMLVLNKPNNDVYRTQFMELIEAFKSAQFLLVERKAVQFLADYKMPATKGKNATAVTVSVFTNFMRTIMAGHVAKETTRGRKTGNEEMPAGDGGLADDLDSMREEAKYEQETESD